MLATASYLGGPTKHIMGNDDTDVLVPVRDVMQGRPDRAIARLCRTGKIPGAIKVGSVWMITRAAWRAFVTGISATETSAAERDLIRAGFRFGR